MHLLWKLLKATRWLESLLLWDADAGEEIAPFITFRNFSRQRMIIQACNSLVNELRSSAILTTKRNRVYFYYKFQTSDGKRLEPTVAIVCECNWPPMINTNPMSRMETSDERKAKRWVSLWEIISTDWSKMLLILMFTLWWMEQVRGQCRLHWRNDSVFSQWSFRHYRVWKVQLKYSIENNGFRN